MLKLATWAAAATLALSLGTVARADDPTSDTVVATVNRKDITLGEMIVTRAQLPQQYQSLPDDVLFKGVLEQLIQQELLAEQLPAEPKRVAITLKAQKRSLMAGEVITQLTAGVPTEDQIKAEYDSRIAAMQPETEYHAAHILVKTEDEAKQVKADLEGGTDFAEEARAKSTGPSGPNGGDLGWFSKGMMVPEFENAVIGMQVDQVSDPVKTQFGWHIIKLMETRKKAVPKLADLHDQIAADLQKKAVTDKVVGLTQAATITRPADGAFDPAVLKNLDLLND